MATLAQVRTETYAILNDLSTTSIYDPSYIDQCINDIEVQICDQMKWSFLRKKYLYMAPARTSLASQITSATTTITVSDTTNFTATSGAVFVNHDVINYATKNATQLLTCTNIAVTHSAGSFVTPLVAVPSTFAKMPELFVQKGSNSQPTKYTYIDEFDYNGSSFSYKYTIVHDTNGVEYLMVDNLSNVDTVMFHYLKKPTTLTDDDDDCTIPDPYALMIIPIFAAARAQMLRGDNIDDEATKKLAMANDELFKMKKHYAEREQGVRKVVQSAYKSRRTDIYSPNSARLR